MKLRRESAYAVLLLMQACDRVCGERHAEWQLGPQEDARAAAADADGPARDSELDSDAAFLESEVDSAVVEDAAPGCGASGDLGPMSVFPLPQASGAGTVLPNRIAICNDGNLWVTEITVDVAGVRSGVPEILRITPDGAITPYAVGKYGSPDAIARGPDGNCWFAENVDPRRMLIGGSVGVITAGGNVSEFPLRTSIGRLGRITAGPDGNVWVVTPSGFTRVQLDGTPAEFNPDAGQFSPFDITRGGQGDGNLWFTQISPVAADIIGRMTPAGVIEPFSLSEQDAGRAGSPLEAAPGPDGNVWFTETTSDHFTNVIGRITPSGKIAEFTVDGGSGIDGITPGPDGNIWFTDNYVNRLGRITPEGSARELDLPFDDAAGGGPGQIVMGSACDLWFIDSGKIVRVPLR